MSISYTCDCCKKTIKNAAERCSIQINFPALEKKELRHACRSCYAQYVHPALMGELFKSEPLISEEEDNLEDNNSALNYRPCKWDAPRVIKQSKYFTPRVCCSLHREIIAGAKPQVLGEKYKIPYQTVRVYANDLLDEEYSFIPPVAESLLKTAIETYGKKLIEIRALLATCHWHFNAIADEVGVPVETVLLYWYNLPWFVENQELITSIRGDELDG